MNRWRKRETELVRSKEEKRESKIKKGFIMKNGEIEERKQG